MPGETARDRLRRIPAEALSHGLDRGGMTMLELSAPARDAIRRNYVYGDLGPSEFLDLITGRVASGAARGVRALTRVLEESQYSVQEAHVTGSADQTMHYTVWIHRHGRQGHHLRLDGNGVIFQVTDNTGRDMGEVPPWVAPGQG
jgi:hypothetical protein